MCKAQHTFVGSWDAHRLTCCVNCWTGCVIAQMNFRLLQSNDMTRCCTDPDSTLSVEKQGRRWQSPALLYSLSPYFPHHPLQSILHTDDLTWFFQHDCRFPLNSSQTYSVFLFDGETVFFLSTLKANFLVYPLSHYPWPSLFSFVGICFFWRMSQKYIEIWKNSKTKRKERWAFIEVLWNCCIVM